ncbi:MAG: 4-(cytidine 5'-diphospho)-2-C-methyl-D-erythritol kinase [Clostridia bacterium]|nr:4-(cytidine 5'-diphospho)-2-C-methyl-D-erythritol kinase [Clostridia bacterium]
MKEIKLQSPAKINLSLSVLGKRDDGYHNIESVMQTVDFGDTVTIAFTETPGITLKTNIKDLPTDETNIAYKAAALMQRTYGITCGISIHLEKRIPIAAGLAGGSGNAAAVLRGINELAKLGASQDELAKLGVTLGADVPFCVYGQPALATGIGEKLKEVKGLSDCYVVLVNPGVGVSTAEIYRAIDGEEPMLQSNTPALLEALQKGDLTGAFPEMKNMMESVAIRFCPPISALLESLRQVGADHAMMSGSGATCFGVFINKPDVDGLQSVFGHQLIAVTKPIV